MTTIEKIREELQYCKKPLIFFHDDPDGLCSFLLLYRMIKEGKGIVIKTNPRIDERFVRKVEEYEPDKVIIVDIAMVDQEFIDRVKVPVIWIDHHEPQRRERVMYLNPRVNDRSANIPASYWCYKIAQQDMWIGAVGCIGDWHMPDFFNDFLEMYPGLAPKGVKAPEKILFDSKLGTISRIFSFCLKGNTADVMQCVKVLTRIQSPDEILSQTSPKGRFVYKKYEMIDKQYQALLKEALKQKKDKLLLFKYEADKMSFTGDLSNELIYKFPSKVIVIAREKSGEMKCSLRSGKRILPPILKKALEGIEGTGGGHEHACGAVIKIRDFDRFIEQMRAQL